MVTQYSKAFTIGFAIGVLFLFVLGVATKRDIRYMGIHGEKGSALHLSKTGDVTDALKAENKTENAQLSVKDQMPGSKVIVEHVEIHESGWVVVHEIEGGHVLNALGATRMNTGIHKDIVVDLLRNTVPGGSYAVILYSDNGNKEFEIRGDLPIIDTAGDPVMQSFKAFGGGASR